MRKGACADGRAARRGEMEAHTTWGPKKAGKRISSLGKTLRSYRAYLDLVETAEWIQVMLRAEIERFGLTPGGFRVLDLLFREGPMRLSALAKKRHCQRQNVEVIVDGLEARGWVSREIAVLPPVETRATRLAKNKRGRAPQGRRIGIVRLTPEGDSFLVDFYPSYTKLVKALLRILDGREQETLSRLCRKLREYSMLKFFRELRRVDA